jgi:Tol biopolymer transport system component
MIANLVAAAAIAWTPLVPAGGSEPAWSSRGQLAFVQAETTSNGRSTPANIVVYRRHKAHFLTHRGINVGPAWAPDGRRIAFVSVTPNRINPGFGPAESRLVVAPTTRKGRRVVFRASGAMSRPTWAPDGRRIAVVAGGQLLIVDTARRTGRVVGPAPGWLPAWSRDGREIAFGGIDRIILMRPDGTDIRAVGPTEPRPLTGYPAWSRDGSQLAFSRCNPTLSCVLFAGSASTGSWDVVYPVAGPDPAWLPDGRIGVSCVWDGEHAGIHIISIHARPGFVYNCGL